MNNQMRNWRGIGVMSGTSLDGLDIAYCTFQGDEQFKIDNFESVPYPDEIRLLLKSAYDATGEDLKNAETIYSDYLADQLVLFIKKYSAKPEFIACHGHTIFHQPERRMTFQMLNGNILLHKTRTTIVFDFRSLDLALNGNGAPLVPIGDKFLFSDYDACLNIGGFANISCRSETEIMAYDICPANIILNEIALEKGLDYDIDGNLAKEGKLSSALLNQLNGIGYYQRKPPKSLGREWLEEKFLPRLQGFTFEKRITSTTEHIAVQIASSINEIKAQTVLCTGGGVWNKYLIDRISHHTDSKLIIPQKEIVEGKEALIFAYMGKRRLENKINVLSSATGAQSDSCSGIVLTPAQIVLTER